MDQMERKKCPLPSSEFWEFGRFDHKWVGGTALIKWVNCDTYLNSNNSLVAASDFCRLRVVSIWCVWFFAYSASPMSSGSTYTRHWCNHSSTIFYFFELVFSVDVVAGSRWPALRHFEANTNTPYAIYHRLNIIRCPNCWQWIHFRWIRRSLNCHIHLRPRLDHHHRCLCTHRSHAGNACIASRLQATIVDSFRPLSMGISTTNIFPTRPYCDWPNGIPCVGCHHHYYFRKTF